MICLQSWEVNTGLLNTTNILSAALFFSPADCICGGRGMRDLVFCFGILDSN